LLWAPACLIVNLVRCRRRTIGWQQATERVLLAYLIVAAVLFHSFYFFWGYNYLRPPLEERLGLQAADFSPASRNAFALGFVEAAVGSRVRIEEWNLAELNGLVDAAVADAVETLEGRATPVVSPLKGDLGTGLLARLGTRGFVSGNTLEAHVDFNLPAFQLPFTAAHEKAHLAGFARERDANFVAWLALSRAGDPRLRYAGYFGVVGYFLNPASMEIAGPLLPDRAALLAYEISTVSPSMLHTTQRVYGTYLRANRMPTGMQDYSQVWQLIQAWDSRP
jgi:hypothetical protein